MIITEILNIKYHRTYSITTYNTENKERYRGEINFKKPYIIFVLNNINDNKISTIYFKINEQKYINYKIFLAIYSSTNYSDVPNSKLMLLSNKKLETNELDEIFQKLKLEIGLEEVVLNTNIFELIKRKNTSELNQFNGKWYGYHNPNPNLKKTEYWEVEFNISFYSKNKGIVEMTYLEHKKDKDKTKPLKYKGKCNITNYQFILSVTGNEHIEEAVFMFSTNHIKENKMFGLYMGRTLNTNLPITGKMLISRTKLDSEDLKQIFLKDNCKNNTIVINNEELYNKS